MKRLAVAALLLGVAAPAMASGTAMKESYLGIPTLIWLALNLGLFLFLLYKMIGKPLNSFLESRRDAIAKELDDARTKLAEAEELRTQVMQRLDQVEGELADLKDRAEREGAAEAERIAEQAKAEEERFLQRVEDEIRRRHNETRQALAADTAALTAQLTRELLSKEITDQDRKRVLDRSLAAMSGVQGRQ